MLIRSRVVLLAATVLVAAMLVLYIIPAYIFRQSFARIEEDTARRNIERVLDALWLSVASIDRTCKDWAWWDDSYDYIEEGGAEHEHNTLTGEVLAGVDVQFVAYVSTSGVPRFVTGVDLAQERHVPPPAGMQTLLGPSSPLLHLASPQDIVSGLVSVDDGLLMVVSRSILRSDRTGPPRGFLIMGRYLDNQVADRIRALTHLPVEFEPLTGTGGPATSPDIALRVLDSHTLTVEAAARDIFGSPVLRARVDLPRTLDAQRRAMVRAYAGLLALVTAVFGGASWWLLDRHVLKRLARLGADADRVGQSGDLTARLPVTGRDEITHLAADINGMISALESTERARRETALRYRLIVENVGACLAIVTERGLFTYVNTDAAEALGQRDADIVGRSMGDLFPKDVARRQMANIQRVVESGQRLVEECETVLRNEARWFDVTIVPFPETIEGEACVMLILHDITERVRNAADVRRARDEWEKTFDALPDLVSIIDNRHRIVRANRALAQRLGTTPEALKGQVCFHCIHGADRAPPHCPHAQMMVDGRQHSSEFSEPHLGGTFLVSATPLRDEDGDVVGCVHVAHDVTLRTRAEREVRRLNADLEHRVQERTAQLETANRELEAFCYSVSHDLRAPLRSIEGFSQILREESGGALAGPAEDHLTRINGAAKKMSRLIDELLGLSRLTRREMRFQEVNLSDVARGILRDFHKHEPVRNVAVVIQDGLTAQGDPDLLRIVLANLLDNAWKFTSRHERACIEFGSRTEGGEPAFFVRDDGAGFDMTYANKLFGAFQRLHDSSEFEGNGIGLATVQRVIQRHGGRVWAEGAVEQGATFYFCLPLPAAGGRRGCAAAGDYATMKGTTTEGFGS